MICMKCGKETTKAFRWDMDASPLPTCDDCAKEIRYVFVMLNLDMEKEARSFTKKWHEPIKTKTTRPK